MMKLATGLRADLRFLAFFLANGTLADDVMPLDVAHGVVFSEPSALEQAFAVWANVLELDEAGRPTNSTAARRRMAQYIRSFIDPSYVVTPPFADWELELHL